MPSCSVHHCVLFLLTLTFTTDPASAAVYPIYAKLHQPVTLPCDSSCDGVAQWNLNRNRDVVFAQCNETSCRSLKDGYEMSHDRYLRGDLSLTITKPDYSMRETYMCECRTSDYAAWSLRISTVFSAVQMSPGEDLKLDLTVPEPVEVIYRGSVSAAGEQICTVTNSRSLQCKAEYTPRTSLSYPELTLRGLGRSETGTYIIRNLDYKEEIRVYAVSVSGLTTGETVMIVIAVLLLVGLLITGVWMYMKSKAKREKEEAERRSREVVIQMGEVDALIQQYKSKPPGEESEKLLQQVKEKIEALEEKYRDDREYRDSIRLFCQAKRNELERIVEGELLGFGGVLMPTTEVVVSILQELERQASTRSMSDQQLSDMYQSVESHLGMIESWCKDQRQKITKGTMEYHMEKLFTEVEMWCNKKHGELLRSREKPEPAGETVLLLPRV